MGLMSRLGYEPGETNVVQRGLQHVVASPPGAWLFSKFMYAVDKPLFRVSGGKYTLPSVLAGLPVVMVTTTGRRSGDARTTPLLAIPSGHDLAIIGSNFGQEHTPGWVYNLEALPEATIQYGEACVEVTARRADDTETDATFAAAAQIYPGYAKYRERADHREIRVYVLEATVDEMGSDDT